MNITSMTRSITCSAFLALAGHALATPILAGSGYPAPGGNTATGSGSDIASGGRTWSYSGFDPSAYANLYYAIGDYQPDWTTAGPSLSMDGTYEPLSFNAALSNLPAGVEVWTGSTLMQTYNAGQVPVATEFVLHITDVSNNPLALTSAASLGLSPSLGGVLQVQGAYNANWSFLGRIGNGPLVDVQDLYNNPAYQTNPSYSIVSSVGGAFYYDPTPVPEPADALMLLFGGGVLIALARYKNQSR